MIRLSETRTLDNYFIDENGVITNSQGEIQKIRYQYGRPFFKGSGVHQIQIYTRFGYKKGYVVHHLDEDITNNSISNLIYIPRSEHLSLHRKGKKMSETTKQKLSEINKGKSHNGFHLSEETKRKMSEAHKGKPIWNKGMKMSEEFRNNVSKSLIGNTRSLGYIWVNNGTIQKTVNANEIPLGYVRGMLKK